MSGVTALPGAQALAELGPPLALAMLRGGIVLLLALLACRALRQRPAGWRHTVLVSALAVQGALLGQALLAPEWRWRVLPFTAAAWDAPTARAGAEPGLADGPAAAPGIAPGALPAASSQSAAPAVSRFWLLVSAVWLAGALVMVARTAAGLWLVHGMVKRATQLRGPRWARLAELGRRRFAIRRPVHLLVSDAVETPVTCGVLRPRILLPPAAQHWSLARCRVVVFHEAAHIAGLDVVAQLMAHLVSALCWINPLVGLVCRAAENERERAADAAVIAAGVRPSSYARHVAEVVRHARRPDPRLALALGPGATPLERRLGEVLGLDRARAAAGRVPLGSSAALAAVCVPLALAAPAAAAVERGPVARVAASGCDYAGGRHLNRTRPAPDGRQVWDVAWAGEGCEVSWRIVGSARLNAVTGAVVLPHPADSVELAVDSRSAPLRIRIRREGGGTVYEVVTASGPRASGQPPAGLRDLVVELDRHTAFAVEYRLPPIARAGGLPAVLREVRAMQGDHAAGVYLARAVELLAPPERDVLAVLAAAQAHVANDYVLGQLLTLLAERYDLRDATIQEEFLRTAERLDARAAREDAVAALRGGRSLAPGIEAEADRIATGR